MSKCFHTFLFISESENSQFSSSIPSPSPPLKSENGNSRSKSLLFSYLLISNGVILLTDIVVILWMMFCLILAVK